MTPQHWVILIFLTAFGGCIGSFLNVVIYRWPRGGSVVSPGSRCPKCNHAIRPLDNIPVFGWLLLNGKCRDCGEPIAGRYALVEGFVAVVVFLGLALNVFYSTSAQGIVGMNNPIRWGLYACQVALVCSMMCAFLIRRDGFPAPKVLYATAILAAIGAGTVLVVTHLPPAGA